MLIQRNRKCVSIAAISPRNKEKIGGFFRFQDRFEGCARRIADLTGRKPFERVGIVGLGAVLAMPRSRSIPVGIRVIDQVGSVSQFPIRLASGCRTPRRSMGAHHLLRLLFPQSKPTSQSRVPASRISSGALSSPPDGSASTLPNSSGKPGSHAQSTPLHWYPMGVHTRREKVALQRGAKRQIQFLKVFPPWARHRKSQQVW